MTVAECLEFGKSVLELEDIESCYKFVDYHAPSMWRYSEVAKELSELQRDFFYHYPERFCKMFDADKEKLIADGWRIKEGL